MAGADADLGDRLQRWLATELSDPGLRVDGLHRLGGGSSRENWAFEAGRSDGLEAAPLLLRRDPVAGVADTDRAVELAVLQHLAGSPVAAPTVVVADLEGARLDRPAMVLERARGRAHRGALRERDPLGLGTEGRAALAVELCDRLALIHDVDAEPLVAALGPLRSDPATTELARWEDVIADVAVEPQPELTYVAAWLRANRPAPPDRLALVHGDFRPANVLVDGGEITVVLDWEFAHLGDPIEDLGWYLAPAYRREHLLAGRWEQADVVARYADRRGLPPGSVRPGHLAFWQVLAMFKLAAIALTGVASFLGGRTTRACAPPTRFVRDVVLATRLAPVGGT